MELSEIEIIKESAKKMYNQMNEISSDNHSDKYGIRTRLILWACNYRHFILNFEYYNENPIGKEVIYVNQLSTSTHMPLVDAISLSYVRLFALGSTLSIEDEIKMVLKHDFAFKIALQRIVDRFGSGQKL